MSREINLILIISITHFSLLTVYLQFTSYALKKCPSDSFFFQNSFKIGKMLLITAISISTFYLEIYSVCPVSRYLNYFNNNLNYFNLIRRWSNWTFIEVNINAWLLHSVVRYKNRLETLTVSSEEAEPECTFRQLVNPAHCAPFMTVTESMWLPLSSSGKAVNSMHEIIGPPFAIIDLALRK